MENFDCSLDLTCPTHFHTPPLIFVWNVGGRHVAGTSPTAVHLSAEWDATEPSLVSYTRTLYGGSTAGNARASGMDELC